MKTNAEKMIEAIVQRLNDKNIRCYDTNIVAEIRNLTNGELNQLVSFGDVDKWIRERNN